MSVLDFVNAKIGTLNEYRFSHGNINPIIARPFGMASFTIQTNANLGARFYNPIAPNMDGIRLTHQTSPWNGDYGHMLFIPYSGKLRDVPNVRWTSIQLDDTVIRPEKLEVYSLRYRVQTKVAPTTRGALFSFTNDDISRAKTGVAFCPYSKSSFEIRGNILTGWTEFEGYWKFHNFREYFYVEFSSAPTAIEEIENDGVALSFDEKDVQMRLSTSFVSVAQAELNFRRELENKTYDELVLAAQTEWESYLNRVQVSNENPERTKTFYSCLYRALLFPRIFHEYDESGAPVHYNVNTEKVEKGIFYTDNGFWDTFRTVYPFLAIFAPEKVGEMVEGFVNYGEETGWLPKWLAPGETATMPGTLVEAVIADAAVKGLIDKNLCARAYKLLLKNAYEKCDGIFGRTGIEDYLQYGYVKNDVKECVNQTCDSAYGDFCIAQIANILGDKEQAEKLFARSKNYKLLFDEKTGFLRGKDENGNFKEPFDPYMWCEENCEGGSWQNSFAVYHDIDGLAALYGGRDKLEKKLDELFVTEPLFHAECMGQEIHEMSEMALNHFGQCAISNQPSFHIPWIFTAIGKREKTEYWVERLVSEAFSSGIDGYPGDEDNGSMSCWYMFACLGFYPLCPGKPEYVTAKPLFEKISIDGKEIRRFEKDVVSYDEIMKK